jgi:type II secretory pathway pseudopilin PulG
MKYLRQQDGFLLPAIIALVMVLSVLGLALATVMVADVGFATHEQRSTSALEIAEAGVNYYMWHLSHNSTDYSDGNTQTGNPPYGPFVHTYTDNNGNVLGTYTLYITPPPSGSTVTTVKSIGQVAGFKGTRTILAQLGIPSFANYALLTNTEVWFGPNENSSGPVQSNVGVHFDGTNNGPVEASNATYTPSAEFGGDGKVHNGVWGNGGPQSQWQFPVPAVDFNSVTANLQTLQTQAQSNGVYLGASGKLGYYLNLKSNGTIDIYTVRSENSSGITTSFVRNQAAPANGIFYVSDNVWVSGTGFPGRITIASGVLPANPSTYTTIKITNNLTYAAKDGTDAIGLIAQEDVQVPQYAPTNLEIDGALLAQNGQVWFPEVNGVTKSNLTLYGAIATNGFWTWSWVDGNNNLISGYNSDTETFDTHLTYAPPPQYPTTGSYSILNWREQLYNP